MWSPGGDPMMPGFLEPVRYVVMLVLCCAIMIAASRRGELRVPLGLEAVTLALLLAYTGVSALWGPQNADSYIKGMLVLTALATSICAANVLGLATILRLALAALSTFVVASVAVAILVPAVGVESSWEHAGKWRGLAGQKNGLGARAALALILAIALPLIARKTAAKQAWAFIGRAMIVLTAALAVYMSGSRGAMAISLVGLFSLAVAYAPPLLQRLAVITALAAIIPIVNLIVSTVEVDADRINVAGAVIDTNSRTTIWNYGLENLRGRELIGFGVGGFWTPERLVRFKDLHGWVLDNFHNGYVTVLIEGGAIGLFLFCLALLFRYLLLFLYIGSRRDAFIAAAFALTNIFCVSNLVENEIGRSTSLGIFLFSMVSFALRSHIGRALGLAGPTQGKRLGTTPAKAGRDLSDSLRPL